MVSLAMQMGQPAAGVQNTAAEGGAGDFTRYEDLAEIEEGNDFGYKKF